MIIDATFNETRSVLEADFGTMAKGQRGSMWFTYDSSVDEQPSADDALPGDMLLDTAKGDVYKCIKQFTSQWVSSWSLQCNLKPDNEITQSKQNLADLSSIRYKNEASGFSMTGTAYGAIYYNGSIALEDTTFGGNPFGIFTIPVGVGRYSIKGTHNVSHLFAEVWYGGTEEEPWYEASFRLKDNEQIEIEVTAENIEFYGGIQIGILAPDSLDENDELMPHTYHNESLQIEIYKLD